jgi:hypothetical protein
MKNIVKLAVLAVIVLIGLRFGRPWLEELNGRIGLGPLGSGTDGQRCVAFAERSVEEFVKKAEKWGTPPINLERWSGSYRLLQGRLQDAYDQCGCEARSCGAGDRALDRLGEIMETTNLSFREGKAVDLVPYLERLRAQLDEAGRLADDGY